jgi:hypothetical protein
MEGKSLAMAYCGSPRNEDGGGGTEASGDIIAIDFGGAKSKPPSPATTESLFAPLDSFIEGDSDIEWQDPASGLVAVQSILARLRASATVNVTPDFEFGGDDTEELTEGVRFDLEELEEILCAAQRARTRFYLAFDV